MVVQDKEGLKEAELRSKLKAIVDKFDLADQFKHHQDEPPEHPNVARKEGYMFRDKKLNKLWMKVQKAGLSDQELRTLKEEFQHHQDKIDQFYATQDKDEKDLANDVELNMLGEEERQNGLLSGDLEKQGHEALLDSYRKLNSRAEEACCMELMCHHHCLPGQQGAPGSRTLSLVCLSSNGQSRS